MPNQPEPSSTNWHRYSCASHVSPMAVLSSSRNSFVIRSHSVAGTDILSHSFPPFAHAFQKNPRFPHGVLISHRSPFVTASIGRRALYIASSTRDASSISSRDTAEKPRTVSSVPGNPTMRLPFGNNKDILLSPSPRARDPRPVP